MGLRSPQSLDRPALRPIGGTELRGGVEPVSNNFIKAAESTLEYSQKKDKAEEDAAFQFVKAKYQIDNDNDRVQSESELAKLQGENALVEGPKIREGLRKRADERLSKVPEKYRSRLLIEPAKVQGEFNQFSYKYEAQQAQKLAQDTFKQRMAIGVNKAVSNSADPARFNEDLKEVVNEAGRVAKLTYGQDTKKDLGDGLTAGEMIEQYQLNAVSNTILRSAQQQLAEGRFDIADRLSKEYSGQLQAPDKKKLQESITSAIRKGETTFASGLADQARREFPDSPVLRDSFIKANSQNEAVLKSARDFDKYNTALEADAKKSSAEAAMAKFSDKAMAPGSVITAEDIAALPAPLRGRAIDFATKIKNNTPIQSNPDEFQRLVDMAQSNPDQFMATKIPRDMLDKQDYQALYSQQKGMIDAEKSEEMRVQRSTEKVVMDIVTSEANARGIRKTNKVVWNKLYSNVRSEYERQLTLKPRSINELRRNMAQALKERAFAEKEKSGWFFGYPKSKVYEVDESMAPQGDELDTAMLDAARRESRRRGLNLTEAQLEQYVRSKQKK